MSGTKKIFIALAVLLVIGIYAYLYGDWFRAQPIQIFHEVAVMRARGRAARENPNARTVGVVFGLDKKYEITELKVVSVADLQTNQNAYALWHMVQVSNTVPVKG